MGRKYFLFVIFMCLTAFSIKCYSQNKFSYGIKGGIGLWKISNLEESFNLWKTPEYSYPIGLSSGIFIEDKLFTQFSLINELLFQYQKSEIAIHTGSDGILEQKLVFQYIVLPILLKYKSKLLFDFYFLLGPSFGYILNADYTFFDEVYHDKGDLDLSKGLKKFSSAIEFGVGKKFDIDDYYLLIELRLQFGLTKFEQRDVDNYNIGTWRNSGLYFITGIEF